MSTSTGLPLTTDAVNRTPPPMLTTEAASPPWQPSRGSVIVYSLVLTILCLLSFFGNLLVCLVIHRSRRLQSTTNSFVVALACADLLFNLTVMPTLLVELVVGRWPLGEALCKLVRFVLWYSPSVAMLVLSCICVDRFYSIIYPLSFKITRGRAKRMILICWTACFVFCSPCFYLYTTENSDQGSTQCQRFTSESVAALFYLCLLAAAVLLAPIGIDVVGYARIFKFVWKAGVGGRTFQRTMNPVPRAKVKMVKMMMVVTLLNAVCFGPYVVIQIWHLPLSTNGLQQSAWHTYNLSTWLLMLTSITKPCAYLCFNSNFRRGCKEVFCMSTMKCYRSYAYTITTASKLGKTNHVGIVHEPVSNGGDSEHPVTWYAASPYFDRTLVIDKASWVGPSPMPSTYL